MQLNSVKLCVNLVYQNSVNIINKSSNENALIILLTVLAILPYVTNWPHNNWSHKVSDNA